MNEKEMMIDLLATEKQVITAYSTGITEASCKNLRNTLVNNFKNVQDVQFKVYDSMKQKGWYSTKDAPDADVSKLKTETHQLSTELV